MKTNKILILVVIVLVLLNIGTLSFLWFTKAESIPKESRRDRKPQIEHFLKKKLDLNQEQVKQFREAREEHFAASRQLLRKMKDYRKQLLELSHENENQQEADSLLKELSSVQEQFERLNYQHMKKLRSYCNENQQITFDSVMISMFEHLGSPEKRRLRRQRGR